jgi:PTH1 family peptidyl-tRNA hydrolase
MTKLVVGLGNPGKEYSDTRHNIGFMVVEKLANDLGVSLKKSSGFLGKYGKGEIEKETIHFLLPETYMNESGVSVQKAASYFKLNANEIVVVMDDVYLPFGTLRVKSRGSHAGHNGLRSIEQHLSTNYYARLKCGIGDERDGSLADHVLSRFTAEEQKDLPIFIDKAVEVLKNLTHQDINVVMNAVNRRLDNEAKEKPLRGDVHPQRDAE